MRNESQNRQFKIQIMEIKDKKSQEIISFFSVLDELLDCIKSTLENRTPALGGEKYLTNRDVSELLHISERTLQDWRDSGRIAYIQISGKVLYRESDVGKVLEENYYSVFKY